MSKELKPAWQTEKWAKGREKIKNEEDRRVWDIFHEHNEEMSAGIIQALKDNPPENSR